MKTKTLSEVLLGVVPGTSVRILRVEYECEDGVRGEAFVLRRWSRDGKQVDLSLSARAVVVLEDAIARFHALGEPSMFPETPASAAPYVNGSCRGRASPDPSRHGDASARGVRAIGPRERLRVSGRPS